MKIKFRPRFFLIVGCLAFGFILYGSNMLLKKKVEIKVVDTNNSGKVLAVSDASNSSNSSNGSYNLIGGDAGGSIGGPLGSPQDSSSSSQSDIAHYQPVTIAYTVKEGDTLASIAEKYHADAQTIADFPNNGLQKSLDLKVGQILIIPNGYINDSQKPPPPPIAHGTGQFAWPAIGPITQYAYYWHPGAIDIAIVLGTPVHAADDGTVIIAGWDTTGYGNTVVVAHGGGLTSRYAHLSKIEVTVGQGVHKGDEVGLSGSTGHSTGPHLHFEVRRNGVPVDPMTLLPSQ